MRDLTCPRSPKATHFKLFGWVGLVCIVAALRVAHGADAPRTSISY